MNYPKLRRRPDTNKQTSPPQWKTTGKVHSVNRLEVEEKERERKHNLQRRASLRVPKVAQRGGPGSSLTSLTVNGREFNDRVNLQGCIPRRRSEKNCRDTLIKYDFENRQYKPPHLMRRSNNQEKKHLSDVFAKKGGKALPVDLTIDTTRSSPKPVDDTQSPTTLFDQLYGEILERREFQLSMEQIGFGAESRQQTANEIAERIEQLRKIDSNRALSVVQRLQTTRVLKSKV